MVVACPKCHNKSRVDDAGVARRARVRCATCRHVFSLQGAPAGHDGPVAPPALGIAVTPATVGAAGVGVKAEGGVMPPHIDLNSGHSSPPGGGAAGGGAGHDDGLFPAATATAWPVAAAHGHNGRPHDPVWPGLPRPPPAVGVDMATDVIGRVDRGVSTGASRWLFGVASMVLVGGFVGFVRLPAFWARWGVSGGRAVAVAAPAQVGRQIVDAKSTLYDLPNGRCALVAWGAMRQRGEASRGQALQLALMLTDAGGAIKVRQPAGIGMTFDAATAEARPTAGATAASGLQPFVAIVDDPPPDLVTLDQTLVVGPAMRSEAPASGASPLPHRGPPAGAAKEVGMPAVVPPMPQARHHDGRAGTDPLGHVGSTQDSPQDDDRVVGHRGTGRHRSRRHP